VKFPHEFRSTGLQVAALNIVGPERIWTTTPLDVVSVDLDGIPGDRHYGRTRKLHKYESPELAGLEVANDRQLSIVDARDMLTIADALELPAARVADATGLPLEEFLARSLAANILVRPSSSHALNDVARVGGVLIFGDHVEDGQVASVKVGGYNPPCNKPVRNIAAALSELGIPFSPHDANPRFSEAAAEIRGWVGSVYSVGPLAVGQTISAMAPIG
jgi:hypothetical protein